MVCCLLLACGLARAALDDKPTVAPGAAVARAAAQTAAGVGYTDVTRTLPSQTVVHEYADASGTVFAVSWSGPFKPDLGELLGTHFDEFRQRASEQPSASRAHSKVATGDLVVESSGHMGAFAGRAWLQSKLPAGFDPHAMR